MQSLDLRFFSSFLRFLAWSSLLTTVALALCNCAEVEPLDRRSADVLTGVPVDANQVATAKAAVEDWTRKVLSGLEYRFVEPGPDGLIADDAGQRVSASYDAISGIVIVALVRDVACAPGDLTAPLPGADVIASPLAHQLLHMLLDDPEEQRPGTWYGRGDFLIGFLADNGAVTRECAAQVEAGEAR